MQQSASLINLQLHESWRGLCLACPPLHLAATVPTTGLAHQHAGQRSNTTCTRTCTHIHIARLARPAPPPTQVVATVRLLSTHMEDEQTLDEKNSYLVVSHGASARLGQAGVLSLLLLQ